jgi:putative Mn2+ efflux pump MntP
MRGIDIITIILLAVGLSMDAFAVSISSGIILMRPTIYHALKIGLFFGGFQAVMPIIGWFLGLGFKGYFSSIANWIAFGLLSLIGIKMIYEAVYSKDKAVKTEPTRLFILLMLSIATSIDALVVGVGFALLSSSIVIPVIIIGIVTFMFSFTGVFLGKRLGELFGKKVEITGGLILIGIGVRILL